MATRNVATVFGGSGFIGRYVVKRLAARGYIVRVAVRYPEAALFLKPMGAVGQIVPLSASVTDEAAATRAIEGAEFVVNTVGILAEGRRGDFQRIQGEGPGRIGRLAAAAGVRRLVHISAIGADAASDSLYARSKAAGEAALLQAFPQATILRPSVVFGPEDQFFNRFATMARMLPFMPVVAGATKFQPVYVGDVADAVMAALDRADAAGRVFELGGPRVLSMREVLTYVLRETGRRPSADRRADGADAPAGDAAGAPARQAGHHRPTEAAGEGQCRRRQCGRADGARRGADPDRIGRAGLSTPVPAGGRHASDGVAALFHWKIKVRIGPYFPLQPLSARQIGPEKAN